MATHSTARRFLSPTRVRKLSSSIPTLLPLMDADHCLNVSEEKSTVRPKNPRPFEISAPKKVRFIKARPLQKGLDVGVYKAIIVGVVGRPPIQKTINEGKTVTLLDVGTGGMKTFLKSTEGDCFEPVAATGSFTYSILWHRVKVHSPSLEFLIMNFVTRGTIAYIEGNMETNVFIDPCTGLTRRKMEIVLRRNSRFEIYGHIED